MKKLLIIIAAVFISINLFAQAPQKMSYQAVIRNASNILVTNTPVKMRISILQGSATGASVYSELHSATTNANGLVSIEIGAGTSPIGTFSSINWGNGTYFLRTETDPSNGTNYSISGTSQLLSVPYALESKNSETAKTAGNGIKEISKTGDTVFLDNGKKYIIPGIKDLNTPSTINNGLVAYYPFNGNANDESGNGNNGAVNGGIQPTSDRNGKSNSAYLFNGIDGYISIPSLNSLPYRPITYSAWVVVNSYFPKSNGHKFRAVVGRNTTFVEDNGIIGFWADANYVNGNWDNNFVMWRGGSDEGSRRGEPPYSKNNPPLNTWIHITFTHDNNGDWKWYINGVLTNSGNFTDAQSDFNHFRIGSCNHVNNYNWNDKLDEIRIYNRVLTQEEITYLANN